VSAITALALAALAAPAAAQAASSAAPACPKPRATRCLRVRVPLDRSAPGAGRLSLLVARLPASGRRRRTVLALSGGPGESSVSGFATTLDVLGRAVRRSADIVSFDARGTGGSGVLLCRALQRDQQLRSTSAAEACARQLGDRRRGAYGTSEQVEDVEAVRRALPRNDAERDRLVSALGSYVPTIRGSGDPLEQLACAVVARLIERSRAQRPLRAGDT